MKYSSAIILPLKESFTKKFWCCICMGYSILNILKLKIALFFVEKQMIIEII